MSQRDFNRLIHAVEANENDENTFFKCTEVLMTEIFEMIYQFLQ